MLIETNSCDIPKILDGNLFTEALKNGLGSNNIQIIKLEFSKGSDGGDNYLSQIFRVHVTYTYNNNNSSTLKKLFLIAKCVIYPGGGGPVDELDVFEKEKYMYNTILPKIKGLLDCSKLMPQCYYATNETSPIIIFEDMKAAGYTIADRITGLDKTHCNIALQKLGEYHAASILLMEKDPSLRNTKDLKRGIFSSIILKSARFEKLFVRHLNLLMNHLSQEPSYDDIVGKLRKLNVSEVFNRVVQAVRYSPDDISVISHGDMWINNIMFRYDESEMKTPAEVVLIDFQGSAIVSLGIDINYFFVTSPMPNLLMGQQQQELLEKSYYPAFTRIFDKYKYKQVPTLMDIKREIQRKQIYALFCGIAILPIISLAKKDSENSSLENLRKEDLDVDVFATKRFLDSMRILMKDYNENGLLES